MLRTAALLTACCAIVPSLVLAADPPPSVDDARAFVDRANAELLDVWSESERAAWVQATFITGDTELLAAKAAERRIQATAALIASSRRFDGVDLPLDLARELKLLRLSLTLPAPPDPTHTAELTRITSAMEGFYGRAKWCPHGGSDCLDLGELSSIMATSRDEARLRAVWQGWRSTFPEIRDDFSRYVELANEGARNLGYSDLGALWRAKYDMPPDAFAADVDRLWSEVKPLYDSLHCFVRRKLNETYGSSVVPLDQPIPAHLLGNMWAQTWDNLYPMLAPADADPGFDLTERLRATGTDTLGMVRYGEQFFSSLGFAPLPDTFWQRSMFTKPRDRDVVCHPSAWDIDWADDLRLKMCIEITGEDFKTIHHELGHNYYQRAYSEQPALFRDSANDGFHEAVGDTLALSITPGYLKKIGLIDRIPPPSKDIGLLLGMALDKVAFLPFGLLVDQYRWKVFSGEITPDEYNRTWWELRERYQGVRPPLPRSEADFDPGAKYHVAANVPYTRYFLAGILQFQLHRGLCRATGYEGPLNRCSIYGNAEAGKRLAAMLEMGQSEPWPDALEAVTGERQIDAAAMLEYFAPLKAWLDQQNAGATCGW